MRMMLPFACFAGGAVFGVVLMSLMVISGDEDRRMEVMDLAGGSGEQDSEPCDYNDKTDCEDDDLGSAHVSPAQREGEGTESL